MEDIKNKPVEIFQVDGTSLYEVAYLGDRQYLLYKVYSPWLGFFNWIPYVHLRRDAQSIHEDIALNYIYKREVKKKNIWELTGWNMLIAQTLPAILAWGVIGGMISFLTNSLLLLFLGLESLCFLIIHYQYKRLELTHPLIKNTYQNVQVRLKNNSISMRRIAIFFFLGLTFLMMPLVLESNDGKFLLILTVTFISLMAFDFCPDSEDLNYTENRIDVIIDPNQKNSNDKIDKEMQSSKMDTFSNLRAKKFEITKTIPFITMSFSDYWSGNQNTGRTMTHKLK
ncbi:hypothetical protein [Weissella minor]|uniref:hypothetical protein n=1 Tax=Weissella minor TaxID=1620 RepID=UPI003AF25A74